MCRQLQMAGSAFIKLGQWGASRKDLFPEEFCAVLSKLHSNGEPHAFSWTERCVENAYGMELSEIFDSFDPEPIGVGAVAQVFGIF